MQKMPKGVFTRDSNERRGGGEIPRGGEGSGGSGRYMGCSKKQSTRFVRGAYVRRQRDRNFRSDRVVAPLLVPLVWGKRLCVSRRNTYEPIGEVLIVQKLLLLIEA